MTIGARCRPHPPLLVFALAYGDADQHHQHELERRISTEERGNIMRHRSLSMGFIAAGLIAGITAAQAANET